jgi:hypothetical protein
MASTLNYFSVFYVHKPDLCQFTTPLTPPKRNRSRFQAFFTFSLVCMYPQAPKQEMGKICWGQLHGGKNGCSIPSDVGLGGFRPSFIDQTMPRKFFQWRPFVAYLPLNFENRNATRRTCYEHSRSPRVTESGRPNPLNIVKLSHAAPCAVNGDSVSSSTRVKIIPSINLFFFL